MMRTDRSGNRAHLFNFIDILVKVYVSSLQLYSRLTNSSISAIFVPYTEAKEEPISYLLLANVHLIDLR